MIDTLKLKETFEQNGFNNTQAKTLTQAMHELSKDQNHFITKDELHEVRNELKEEIKGLRQQINLLWDRLRELKEEITRDMALLEERIVHKLTHRTIISQISIATVLISLMFYFHQNP